MHFQTLLHSGNQTRALLWHRALPTDQLLTVLCSGGPENVCFQFVLFWASVCRPTGGMQVRTVSIRRLLHKVMVSFAPRPSPISSPSLLALGRMQHGVHQKSFSLVFLPLSVEVNDSNGVERLWRKDSDRPALQPHTDPWNVFMKLALTASGLETVLIRFYIYNFKRCLIRTILSAPVVQSAQQGVVLFPSLSSHSLLSLSLHCPVNLKL